MQDIHRLIIALAEKKKTCKWLSEELGVNPSTVNKWCTNSSQTDIETLGKVSKLLCVFFFCTLCLHAQEGLYEQMKAELNEQSLPLVNMTVDVTALNETDFVPGEIEITDYYRRTDPESETVRYHCKYRIRGGISTAYEKKSFAVKLYDDSGKDLDANIFGIREENSWILDAMANDRIRMRNRVCFDLWNEMGHTPYDTKYDHRNGTKGVFVEVFVNGDYHGLYCMTDKIDRKLLGLKKAKEENGEVTIKGLLYKCDNWSTADSRLVAYGEADTNTDRWISVR